MPQTEQQRQSALNSAGLTGSQQAGVKYGVPQTDINSFQNANPSLTFNAEDASHYFNGPFTITSSQLNQQAPIQIPKTPSPTLPQTSGASAMLAANAANLNPTPEQTGQQQDNLSSIFEKYLGSQGTPPSQAQQFENTYGITPETAKAQRTQAETGLNTANAAVQAAQDKYNALQAQISGLDYQGNVVTPEAQQQAAEGRGITAGGLAPITASEQRRILLQKAPLQLQALTAQADLAAAQGKATLAQGILNQANSHIDSLFQAQSADATNQYNYQKDLRNQVYQFATDAEKRRLDAQQKAADQAHSDQQNSLKYAQDLAKTAVENGQSSLAARIMALDPTSKTYRADVAALQGQIAPKASTDNLQFIPGTANQPAGTFNKSTGVFIPIAGGTKETGPLQLAQTKAKIDQLSALTGEGGLGSAVGTSFLTRAPSGVLGTVGGLASIVGAPSVLRGAYNKFTGAQQNFIGDVEQLRSQLNLDALINAKAQGATFGALSDQELRVLSSSATKLGTWAIHQDPSNQSSPVVGYDTSKESFKKEIDKINNFAKLDYIVKGGDPKDVNAQIMPDGTVWTTNSDGTYTQIK